MKSFKTLKRFQSNDEQKVIKRMFKDETVQASLGLSGNHDIKVKLLPLSCSILSMSFFDKLVDLEIISDIESGYIRGCYEEEIDGILVQDKLRLMCANDNLGEYEMDQEDRDEFIFHLMKLVCVGGAKCQCEDRFHNFKNAIKTMYKDIVQVRKDANGKVEISSTIYMVKFDDNGSSANIFPNPKNVHNKCFAITSGGQSITLMIKKFVPFW